MRHARPLVAQLAMVTRLINCPAAVQVFADIKRWCHAVAQQHLYQVVHVPTLPQAPMAMDSLTAAAAVATTQHTAPSQSRQPLASCVAVAIQ